MSSKTDQFIDRNQHNSQLIYDGILRVRVSILRGSAATQTVSGGLTIYPPVQPVANFLYYYMKAGWQ